MFFYRSHYGHDTISIGGGTRTSYVYVENFQGLGATKVDIYLSGVDTTGKAAPGHAILRGATDAHDPLPTGSSQYGTNVVIHGTAHDTLTGALTDYNDTFDFSSGKFDRNNGSVGVGLGNDTVNLNLSQLSFAIVYGSTATAGLDGGDILQFDHVTKTGGFSLLQYDHSKSTGNLIWDGGNGYGVVRTSSYFEFVKLDSAHFTSYTANGHTFWSYNTATDYAALIEDTIATPVTDQATILPFNLTLAAFHAGTDVFNVHIV